MTFSCFRVVIIYAALLVVSFLIAQAALGSFRPHCPCVDGCTCEPCDCPSMESIGKDGRLLHRLRHPLQPLPKPLPK